MAALINTFRRHYGASPLHLLAFIVSVAVTGAALAGWLAEPEISIKYILIWFVGAIIVHDLIVLPLYSTLDRLALTVSHHEERPTVASVSPLDCTCEAQGPSEAAETVEATATSEADAPSEAGATVQTQATSETDATSEAQATSETDAAPEADADTEPMPAPAVDATSKADATSERDATVETDSDTGPQPVPDPDPEQDAGPVRSPGWVYVRIPLALSALLLLVFGAEILREGNATFRIASGHTQDVYLSRYLIVVAILFLLSGFAYVRSSARASSRIP